MGRLVGDGNKRSAERNKHLIVKEAIRVNSERTCRVEQLKGNDGELPLFFSSSSPHFSSRTDDLNFGHKPVEPGWPLGSQESGSWASSFRFELDSPDDERLQAMLERDEQIPAGEANLGRKLTDRKSLTASGTFDDGSFRFLGNEELQGGSQCGHLKSPRQPGSFRFTTVFNANESKGYDVAQSGDRLNDGIACIKVAVNDHVPASPRSEVLRRLRDLKAHPLSPRFTPEDTTSCQRERAKIVAVKDDIKQRLKPLLKTEYSGKGSYSPINRNHCKPQASVLSELEIMEIKERRRQIFSSPSEPRGSPRRTLQPPSPTHPTTPTLRFRDDKTKLHGGRSKQERIVEQSQIVVRNISSPSPDHLLSRPVAVPFIWEEEPGKPKTIAAAVDRALARRLSRDGIEDMELQLGPQKTDVKSSVENGHPGKGTGPEASGVGLSSSSNVDQRSGSHRYYGRDFLGGLSREASLRRSTRRYSTSEKEALIDLDGSAAAKFLVEAFESPSRSHGSSPTFLVPFKWEEAPGKPKVETIAQRPNNVLQLPPRLVLSSLTRPESFSSREQRASSPFAGFFLPCLAASMPVHRKQFSSSNSLPPRLPSPPEFHTRRGLVNRCSSTPKEGCQVWVSKSKASSQVSSEKSLTELQVASARKCTNLSISELKTKSNAPSSPTSILCGPDEGNAGSQTSGSSVMFSSGDLEDFNAQTRKSASKSSSSTSHEYADEDLAEFPVAAETKLAVDTGHLNKQGAPVRALTPSDYRISEDKTLTPGTLKALQSEGSNSSPEASPKRPSRLPYTMPSAAEQLLASCSTSGRRQLLQDLSPRLLHQFSNRRLSGSHSGANTPYRHLKSSSLETDVSPSPPQAASMERFSSPANQHRRGPGTPKAFVPKSPPARPRRRVRILSSIIKTLMRALGRKKKRLKRSEPMLTYDDGGKAPAAGFRFKASYV